MFIFLILSSRTEFYGEIYMYFCRNIIRSFLEKDKSIKTNFDFDYFHYKLLYYKIVKSYYIQGFYMKLLFNTIKVTQCIHIKYKVKF